MSVSKNKKNYAVFNAANFSEAGLKPFARSLSKKGCPVASMTATNKALKKDGVSTKKVKLYFENQQAAEIMIGDKGDIITLKINGKVQPTGQPKKMADFANHITSLLKSSQSKFDTALKKRLSRIKTNTADKKPANRSNLKRIDESSNELKSAQKELERIKTEATRIDTELSEKAKSEAELKSELESEMQRTKTLRSEFNSIGK